MEKVIPIDNFLNNPMSENDLDNIVEKYGCYPCLEGMSYYVTSFNFVEEIESLVLMVEIAGKCEDEKMIVPIWYINVFEASLDDIDNAARTMIPFFECKVDKYHEDIEILKHE